MRLDRDLIFLDIESTGVDPVKDRIVELAMVLESPSSQRKQWVQRFNPGIPIPKEATEVHGIRDEDVASCPMFSTKAETVMRSLLNRDIGGYNLWRYDLPLLDEELRRCGFRLDLTGKRVIDCFGIFSKKEPRRLEDAVRRFCGREHDGAHGAGPDAVATADVFIGQLDAYEDLRGMSLDQIAQFSRNSDFAMVDLAGKLYRSEDGVVRFAFGKHKGSPIRENLDYCKWMLRGGFPASTIEAIQDELNQLGLK